MNKLLFIGWLLFLISCNNSKNNSETQTSKKYEEFIPDMYIPSEMTMLMRSFYEENKSIKQAIINGKTLEAFPTYFEQITTAELTDSQPKNEIFNSFAKIFVENQKLVFDASSSIPIIERHNNAINTCISCHTTECVGPIPKIKKLLIH